MSQPLKVEHSFSKLKKYFKKLNFMGIKAKSRPRERTSFSSVVKFLLEKLKIRKIKNKKKIDRSKVIFKI